MKNIFHFFSNLIHPENAANDSEHSSAEIRQAIRELQSLSDRDLSDMGLARSEIEYAVRYGRKGIDDEQRHVA
ncbi:DUF1127 domain-containing protein [uncultured Thiothrix sp.]|uniref:DUF1127 domain-containing protein n=1 Tax=uncultured Thiothrix sp. TaxID=223185 RepID=UPI002611FCAC|nr:DUF1127 domain-containing protein [uncultured Thiothrix sp.]